MGHYRTQLQQQCHELISNEYQTSHFPLILALEGEIILSPI